MRAWPRLALALCLWTCFTVNAWADEPVPLRAGAAMRDITPPPGLPMWGYGARHDALAVGQLDPLRAKAVVVAAGTEKLAIVGLDLGRGPTAPMMDLIRREVAEAGIRHLLISGSHTHHGPVIELTDQPGFGRGKFDAAVAYSQALPHTIAEAILEAGRNLKPVRVGVATKSVALNRNRQAKHEPKPTDPMLAVIRFDDLEGQPIATIVNFAAHPVLTDAKVLKYSADYPGVLQARVESALGGKCLFMQGAAGDMSVNPPHNGPRDAQSFGEALAEHVLEIARTATSETPREPSIKSIRDTFHFKTRVDLANPVVVLAYERAFFPELIRNYARDCAQGIDAELTTVLLNGEIALVGASGEFFCNHAVRLKQRSYMKHTLFFGYCNGHSMYFPTIEAAFEGGYGADAGVSLAEIGAGEKMMDRALINIYTLQGKFAPERRSRD